MWLACLVLAACGAPGATGPLPDAPAQITSAGDINQRLATGGMAAVSLPAGTFRIDEDIVLSSRQGIAGAGPGVTVLRVARSPESGSVISNADPESGNDYISLSNLTVDCNGKAKTGVFFSRVANLTVSNVELMNCTGDGLRISGRGLPTRGMMVSNIVAHHNMSDGVIILWAAREVLVSNIRSFENGRHGVVFDHSEGSAVNVVANGNSGRGIYFRNLFSGSYTNMTATRNGEQGIYVEGFVASAGSAWKAQGNGRRQADAFDEIYLSATGDLSYGITRGSVVTGVIAGGNGGIEIAQARYGIARESADIDIELGNVRYGLVMRADQCDLLPDCPARILD